MSFQTGNLPFSGSAPQPADDSKHHTAQQLARGLPTGWGNDHKYRPDYHSAQQPGQHSHRSSAKPPAGELPMARGVSLKWTITTDPSASTVMEYDQQWDAAFFNIPEERKYFWRRATEIIFMCEPKLLLDGKYYRRCDALIQQDYIHSCGVLFASKAQVALHRHLQRKFRASCKPPVSAEPRFRLLNIAPNIA